MTKNPIFRGAATALITPLTPQGIDYDALQRLIDWQIQEGTDAIVVAGTTGEGSTLTDEEHRELFRKAYDMIGGRVPAIATTGSNDTDYAIELTREACEIGYDAMLVITPYYNKATQKGLIQMFTAIADASTKPLILYNVPSRTGVDIAVSTYKVLAEHPRIQAVKEASGNLSKIAELAAAVGDKMDIYSGNDEQTLPILSLGGTGVISVLSNLMPKEASRMCHAFFEGSWEESRDLQLGLIPLINSLFTEVNPIPVKAAMAAMGYCQDYLRLPLTCLEEEHRQVLLARMAEQKLI